MSEQFFIDKFSITNAKVITQVKERFESFHYSIVLSSNGLLQSGALRSLLTEKQTDLDKMKSYYKIKQIMKRAESNAEAYNVGIMVTGINGISYATDRSYWLEDNAWLQKEKKYLLRNGNSKKISYDYDHAPASNAPYVIASKRMTGSISGINYGVMHFAIKENDFREFYSTYTNKGNDIYILNTSGVVVSSNRDDHIGKTQMDFLDYATKIEHSSKSYVVGDSMGKETIFFSEYLPAFDMYVINVIDKDKAIGGLIDKKVLAYILLSIIIAASFILFVASRQLTNALSRLVKQISDVSKHDFHQFVSVTGTYETRRIGEAFNVMLEELHEYVEKLLDYQRQKQNAELAALQQQINPHFLYNTLTSIKFMVQHGSNKESEEIINAFISLLKNTVGNVNETITVKQEIDNLKDYVLIQQKRYGNRIKINYFIAPDCLEIQIPKLILQPFIENAFFHGFNYKQKGNINVLVQMEGKDLKCEVFDNGDGMELLDKFSLPDTKRKQDRFSGIGIRNVHERIQLIYGKRYGVEIVSQAGEGTKVQIIIPIIY
ncbi:histidine kinase [Virgibacillus pantothenticus]|nr:histidine kinase [Virgibacillus pantothenticus]MEB5453030.1 histidine kinase [Virgibacillus pantothenticus]MEB5461109.1 histidine kinase [Virgibacillus pantothenticus]MEB5465597.1 histidine kinase [Virgibacillus pantothenticus]GIP65657.1 histidine kinase [Virgibacillus pantothenticus]